MDLNPITARDWLRDRLGFGAESVTPLSGGVSSIVLLAEGYRRIVVKQALPKLQVQAQWLCDPRRALRESAALRAIARLLPAGSVPEVLTEDDERCAFAMSAAPRDFETWKTRLLRGTFDAPTARATGDILAALIDGTAGRFQDQFGDMAIFDDLRLDAYYRYTASRHPDLGPYFDALIADCVRHPRCLVHGDYSPKNILTDGRSALVIDWECVHYGNPAFDTAFLLNHLLLKSFHRPEHTAALATVGRAFWTAVEPAGGDWLLPSTLSHWPGLLLARIDGKSPVEYIRDEGLKGRVREFARELIARRPTTVDEVFARRLSYSD